MKKHIWVILAGVAIGVIAMILTALGNPGNMGFCIACFLRDTAGACKLHAADAVQFMRPEIPGLVMGALLMALRKKEFRARGGSAPMTRFVLGFSVMVGALMFLGCPLRMLLRIGGGDLNALFGVAGFAAGSGVGTFALHKGFSLRRTYAHSALEGAIFPAALLLLFLLNLFAPALFAQSAEGPGSMRAPVLAALAGGLIVGAISQRARFCTVGGIRDAMLFRDFHLLYGAIALIVTVVLCNLLSGAFRPGFADQPIAHTDGLWNFLGMALTGWASVLLGGCPLRQLILAGEGNTDSAITVVGLIAGAAFCHNFDLASSAAGPTTNGMLAVAAGFVAVAVITVCNIAKE